MTDKEKLQTLRDWAESSHAYLSGKEGYARGYRDGIAKAKETVLGILGSTYAEVRTDFYDDEKGAWAVDAWTSPDEDDNGRTVAWIHDDGTVEWKLNEAADDALIKEAVESKLRELAVH